MRTYMNTYHVAKSLGVNVQTVRHYIRQGELGAARVGKRYVVTQEDIDAFLERRKEKRSLEHVGLTDKGQETARKIKEDSERILTYLRECPGAGAVEITSALDLNKAEAQRALRRLEAKDLAYCEPSGEKLDRSSDPWYAGSQQGE